MQNTYRRGQYPRGHGVGCKHCGHSYEEHRNSAIVRNPKNLRKGFGKSFSQCVRYGYEPVSLMRWARRERAFQRQERIDFEMECYEQQARASAAWGVYGGQVRAQNHARTMQSFEKRIGDGSASDRTAASRDLEKYLESRQNGMLVVGGGGRYYSDD